MKSFGSKANQDGFDVYTILHITQLQDMMGSAEVKADIYYAATFTISN